jgi:hypothetical protein
MDLTTRQRTPQKKEKRLRLGVVRIPQSHDSRSFFVRIASGSGKSVTGFTSRLQDMQDRTIMEWWDEDARQAIEDGFLDPRDLLGSATEYAKHLGVL